MIFRKRKKFENASLADFGEKSSKFQKAIEWLKSFLLLQNNVTKTLNLIVFGSVGIGKTHLINAFINDYIKKHKIPFDDLRDCFWLDDISITTLKGILDNIKSGIKKGECSEISDYIKNQKLLVVDEVIKNLGSDFERAELFDIFNYRYENELPTVLVGNLQTSNDKYIDVKTSLSNILGRRTTSRLLENATVLEIIDKDKRQSL